MPASVYKEGRQSCEEPFCSKYLKQVGYLSAMGVITQENRSQSGPFVKWPGASRSLTNLRIHGGNALHLKPGLSPSWSFLNYTFS